MLLISFALFFGGGVSEDSLWAVLGTMGASQAGLNDAQIGLVLSGSTAGGVLASLFMTAIGNRLGRTEPLIVLVLLGSALKFVIPHLGDSAGFMVTVIIWNTIYALVFAYVSVVAAALDRSGRWSAPLTGVYLVGSALAPFAGTFITEQFGFVLFGTVISLTSSLVIIPFSIAARRSAQQFQPIIQGAESLVAKEVV